MGLRFAGQTCSFKQKLNERALKDEMKREMLILANKKKFRDTMIGDTKIGGPGPSDYSMEAMQQELSLKPKQSKSQSTVSMKKMTSVKRNAFLFRKLEEDYGMNYHAKL